MTASEHRSKRVRLAHIEWVAERLGEREWAIILSVGQLRLMTSTQLERLHFAELSDSSRARIRRRVLARLADWRVIVPLERRIGGVRAGSSGLIVALDSCGQQLLAQQDGSGKPARRPHEPGLGLVRHTLAVSELYVALVELSRSAGFTVSFQTEPRCWWPDGLGGWLKPDAYLTLGTATYTDTWWLEQDMATEHLPTIRRKLDVYLNFAEHGLGPGGVMPRVLLNVPDEGRQLAIASLINGLSDSAAKLVHVITAPQAAGYLLHVLRE